jgi:hypothetical protein
MSERSCATCACWIPDENTKNSVGECHRLPPRRANKDGEMWPVTTETEWCYEGFVPKQDEEHRP